tara:strand:- start:64 stop:384 length:321 start_codon:yes stop_codon:yes gene_type:complete
MDLYLNLLHLLYQYQDLVLNLQKLRLLLLHLHHLDLYQDYLQAMNLDFLLADQMIRHYQHLIQSWMALLLNHHLILRLLQLVLVHSLLIHLHRHLMLNKLFRHIKL